MARKIESVFVALLIVQIYTVECQRFPQNNKNVVQALSSSSSSSFQRGFFHKAVLDSEGKYVLEWAVDWNDRTITFNITAETTGWVGLGLSSSETMSGADIVIGGMHPNGVAYVSDRHAIKHQMPILDSSQDWILLDCVESGSHTFVSVKRKLDTCDPYDYPITESRVGLIWAYGNEDKGFRYHGEVNRGTYNVYLLDPSWSPTVVRDEKSSNPIFLDTTGLNIPSNLKTWTIPRYVRIPKNATSYLCSIHRAPILSKKHHVIGYDVHFGNEASRKRVHHLSVFRCQVPRAGLPEGTTANSLFGGFVGKPPQTCVSLLAPTGGSMPTQYCTELFFGYASGGRTYFNPEHVGFPLGNDLGENEFYMIQTHYDNPEELENVLVDNRIDLFYTSTLRPNEGGMLNVIHEVPGQPESFLLPPNTASHRIYGHCSAECTRRMLGPGGKITIYAVLLHSHYSGRRLRIHHFRGGKELPWIAYDDNWTNDYQQLRNLRTEVEVMAGDQLTMDCDYDTTGNNGSTVVGGYTTSQEMCVAFIFYYNRIWDYHVCASSVVSMGNRRRFLNGVENVTWSEEKFSWIVNDSTQLNGLTIQEVSDNHVEWDDKLKDELQREQTFRPHQGSCYRDLYSRNIPILPFTEGLSEDDFRGPVHYPLEVEPYSPPGSQCDYDYY